MPPDRTDGDRIYVVRHADAGVRTDSPDDHLRPLSSAGHAHARILADRPQFASVGDVVSSPYVRCAQSVEPLAARHHRPVSISNSLAEGAPIEAMLHLLRRLPDGSVACTHGDMLQELVVFIDNVEDLGDPIPFDKGGIWVLSRTGDVLSAVEHLRATQATVDDRTMISCLTE